MRANDDCIGSTIASVVELKSPNNPESKKPDLKEIEKLNAKSAIYRTVQKQHIRKLKGGCMWPALKSTLASAKKLESLIDKYSIKRIFLLFRCVYKHLQQLPWSVCQFVVSSPQSRTLTDFHCVGTFGPSQSIRGPRDVIYFPKAMTNSFHIFIGGVEKNSIRGVRGGVDFPAVFSHLSFQICHHETQLTCQWVV